MVGVEMMEKIEDEKDKLAVVVFRCRREQKGRWVKHSRREGLTLTEWITRALEVKNGDDNRK